MPKRHHLHERQEQTCEAPFVPEPVPVPTAPRTPENAATTGALRGTGFCYVIADRSTWGWSAEWDEEPF